MAATRLLRMGCQSPAYRRYGPLYEGLSRRVSAPPLLVNDPEPSCLTRRGSIAQGPISYDVPVQPIDRSVLLP